MPTSSPAVAAPHADYDLFRLPTGTLAHARGLALIGSTAYTIDQGALREIVLSVEGGLRAVQLQSDNRTRPTKDLIDLAISPDGTSIWMIDKMGDLLEFKPGGRTLNVRRSIEDRYSQPSQMYVGLTVFDQRAYILDESQGQIWRFPAGKLPEGYIPGVDVWDRLRLGYDLTRAVDIAVDGDVYLLLREEPEKQRPARVVKLSGAQPAYIWEQAEGSSWHTPARIITAPGKPLYLVTEGGKKLIELDKQTGVAINQRAVPLDGVISDVAFVQDKLAILSPDKLYFFPGTGLDVSLPSAIAPLQKRPDDLTRWANVRFQLPVAAEHLPDRDSLLPGAPRLYRFGIHEGLDFFGIATGSATSRKTPVKAAGPGVVIRVDNDYRELTLDEYKKLLEEAESLRNTPETTEDRLRGRQVWIDHGDGIVTRYAHLSSVVSGLTKGQHVVAGDTIGYVGNSGVEGGIHGSDEGLHLHFEIRSGDTYLGRWLDPLETRRLFQTIFFEPQQKPRS